VKKEDKYEVQRQIDSIVRWGLLCAVMARSHRDTFFVSTFNLYRLFVEGSSSLLLFLVLGQEVCAGFLFIIGGGLHPRVVLDLFYGVALGSIEGE